MVQGTGQPPPIPETRALMGLAIGFSTGKLSSGLRSKFGGLPQRAAEKEGAECPNLIPMHSWFMA
jgi:hypothetical protein